MTDIYAVVGKNLQKRRKQCGLTQAEVAEKAGISVAFLSFLETGRKKGSLDSYHRLATVLGVSMAFLMGEQVPKGKKIGVQQIGNFSIAEKKAVYRLAKILNRK